MAEIKHVWAGRASSPAAKRITGMDQIIRKKRMVFSFFNVSNGDGKSPAAALNRSRNFEW
jgi:hypothetical protein